MSVMYSVPGWVMAHMPGGSSHQAKSQLGVPGKWQNWKVSMFSKVPTSLDSWTLNREVLEMSWKSHVFLTTYFFHIKSMWLIVYLKGLSPPFSVCLISLSFSKKLDFLTFIISFIFFHCPLLLSPKSFYSSCPFWPWNSID